MNKKILIIFSSSYIGGAEKNLIKLASKKNTTSDLDYYLFTFGSVGKLHDQMSLTTKKNFSYHSKLPIFNLIYIIKLINKYNFDYLYVSGFRYSIYLRILKILIPKVKIVIAQRWNPSSNRMIDIILRFSERFLYKITYGYISNTSVTTKQLQKIIPQNEKLETIYNGIEKYNISKNKKKIFDICVLAHISKNKGHFSLLEKIYEIKKIYPKIQVVFVGINLLENKLIDKINSYSLQDNINLVGYTDNAYSYLLKSKIYVLPSRQEGLPTSILEALNVEVPVVTYDIDGNGEAVIDNFNGFLVNANKDNLIEKIIELLSSEDIYNKFCNNSSTILHQKFTDEAFFFKHNKYFLNEKS